MDFEPQQQMGVHEPKTSIPPQSIIIQEGVQGTAKRRKKVFLKDLVRSGISTSGNG
jgi:hypothetical protein